MNIECDNETLSELEHSFKFNDAVLRHLIIRMERSWITPSPMMKEEKARSVLSPGEAPRGEAPRSEVPKPVEAAKPAEPVAAKPAEPVAAKPAEPASA
jgi:hypothetical protein